MKPSTIKTQKENVKFYLDELRGMKAVKGRDLLEMIEEAKEVKSMIVNNMVENPALLKYYKGICDVILQCYNDLPDEKTTSDEKTTIEQAMDILFSHG